MRIEGRIMKIHTSINILILVLSIISVDSIYGMGRAPDGDPTYIKCYGVNLENDLKSGGYSNKRAHVVWLPFQYYGSWKSKELLRKDNFFEVWTDKDSMLSSVDQLKVACRSKLHESITGILPPDNLSDNDYKVSIKRVKVVAQVSSLAAQYVVIDRSMYNSSGKLASAPSTLINLQSIYEYASASSMAYKLENSGYMPNPESELTDSERITVPYFVNNDSFTANGVTYKLFASMCGQTSLNSGTSICKQPLRNYDGALVTGISQTGYTSSPESNLHAAAFINTDKKQILIAYKGTSNSTDFVIDAQLMAINAGPLYGPNLKAALLEAINFYRDVKLKRPDYQIILTGHSLGGFISAMVAAQTGEIARIFSSPATYISSTALSFYTSLDNNFIPLENVINIGRGFDPVMIGSGRHVEAMVYFPSSATYQNPAASHSINDALSDIYRPNAEKNSFFVGPTHMYFYASTSPGWGLNNRTDYYNSVPAQ